MPVFEGFRAFAGDGVVVLFRRRFESIEPIRGVVQMGLDGLLEETGDQFAEGEFGFEMFAALPQDDFRFNSPHGSQEAETGTGGAFADLQSLHDIIEAERFFRGKEQPVDHSDGSLRTDGHGDVSEELNGFIGESRCRF